ncbi:C4-dicarboxylate transporter DctA [Legionella nagasakiensis]|uniref:C4-dicarboxylate transporter DctA n=1 Tax=Legionella nagasakiensis TaxID=535290 RepID=UPI001054FB99|nr:C4-dicarboxylate transporter DctA [Legionella nagasakiensis]
MAYLRPLYIQVLIGIIIGVLLGLFFPDKAVIFKPLSDAFIKLIKMLIAPIIFLSLVSGITAMSDLKEVGKIGASALLYFMMTTTFALCLGLFSANLFHPGTGLHINPDHLDISVAKHYLHQANPVTDPQEFILNIIPVSFFSAFTEGEILQTVLVAILFSVGIMMVGDKAKPILQTIQIVSTIFFKIIHLVMYLAPVAAFAAMAYCIGEYGATSLFNLLSLLVLFYITCFLFVVAILGTLLRLYCQLSIFKLVKYIKTELLIALGTSSSETVLPNLMEKLEQLGCKKSVVGFVLPVGYSFNLDGTAIYLTLAALFIAQATNIDLSIGHQLSLLAIMIISSKGAAGVSGSGFVVLASSLAAIGHVPVAGIVLILGIERLMSDGRTITNIMGNMIATILIATWQQAFDPQKARLVLEGQEKSTIHYGFDVRQHEAVSKE